MIPFMKIEVLAGEHDPPVDVLAIETQGTVKKPIEKGENPIWNFTVKCVDAVDAVFDTLTESEKDELRAELRKFLETAQSEEV